MRLGTTLLTAVVAVTTTVLVACGSDSPSTSEEAPSVRGSWLIVAQTPGPPFEALAAFGAGGVFITTGSDIAGTGIGQWVAKGDNGFVFSYKNFHFDPDGKLASITTVNAEGTFEGDTLSGTASQSAVDASGGVIMEPQIAPFTGTRVVATAPET